MSAATCPHGYPSPLLCLDCIEDQGVGAPPRESESMVAVFPARFAGQCPECDLPIVEGERIVKTTRDRYLHSRCCVGVLS